MIERIFSYAKATLASDVHLSSGARPMVRVDGDMSVIPDSNILKDVDVAAILNFLMSDRHKAAYKKNLELDFSIEIEGKGRFRVNAFNNINGPAAVFREIPTIIKGLSSIHAPEIMRPLSNCASGLILIVGPTGSGKSTTLAAMIDHINENRTSHIITIEDPVEFIHTNKKSLINQREVGESTLSFGGALKSALREDPDVILVGEMRDIETISLALTAAETGHLVLATLHTSSAAQTINRIIDVFPREDKALARSMLSVSLKAIISQKLLKKSGGGRCAAYEIMVASSSIRNLIREDKVPQINSIIELSRRDGMLLMKDSVKELLSKGFISRETALEALNHGE
jgi:twitching motility protein PilT